MVDQCATPTYRIETPRLMIRKPVVTDASAIRTLLEDANLDIDDKVVNRIAVWKCEHQRAETYFYPPPCGTRRRSSDT
jgi:hypothetical protein